MCVWGGGGRENVKKGLLPQFVATNRSRKKSLLKMCGKKSLFTESMNVDQISQQSVDGI